MVADDTERGRLRRAAMLRAAERCFARRGDRASSVRDVCAEAGISIGGFCLSCSSREAVVEALARVLVATPGGLQLQRVVQPYADP